MGPNPAKEVQRRRIPKRKPDFLRTDEVPRVLDALDDRWRPLFATAIYTGLRKGELLGLTKAKVDLRGRLLYVGRSYSRNTTKGQHEEAIPIATEVVPFLRYAMDASPSDLVFPRPDGSMMREDVDVENVLRRALARAGIVLTYQHVCRRKGCGHSELAQEADLRHCPKCNMKLWPKAKVRPIRFHDLRHTTASLLLMAGANPAAVQRILRHSDPRITTEVYGHLVPDYLRAEIDRLSFGIQPPAPPSKDSQAVAGSATAFGPPVVQGPVDGTEEPAAGPENPSKVAELKLWARQDSNLLPPAPEAGALSR
jgi:integrase